LKLFYFSNQLHAQYNDPDEYEAHRVAQSFEMGQFIRHTSDACDLVIVAGDLNFRPDQLGYKVIRSVGNVEDSWVVKVGRCHVMLIVVLGWIILVVMYQFEYFCNKYSVAT